MKLFTKLLLSCFLAFSFSRSLQAESPVWFNHIHTPMPLKKNQGEQFCATLRTMLLAKQSDKKIIASFQQDAHPRVLFLALGDNIWPERIYIGSGPTFCEALQDTLEAMHKGEKKYIEMIQKQNSIITKEAHEKNEIISKNWQQKLKDPTQWNTLRLSIVQQTKQFSDFAIPYSKILLTNLNGIAFPKSTNFAFLPEQLSGRYLITPDHFFSSDQMENIFSEVQNFTGISTWLKLCTRTPPFPIILFDVASFFADGKTSAQLFRGHTAFSGSHSADQLLSSAEHAAQQLLPFISKKGTLSPPFPEWVPSNHGKEHPIALAELSIAFSQLFTATQKQCYLDAAKKINTSLTDLICKFSSHSSEGHCLVEQEILDDPNNPQEPRKIVNTYSNAITALALLDYTQTAKSKEFLPEAELLIHYLAKTQQRDGTFLSALVYPEMQPPSEQFFSKNDLMELSAIASLAMHRYRDYDSALLPFLDKRIQLTCSWFCNEYKQEIPLLSELPLSPWVTKFLTEAKTATSKDALLLAWKIAVAATGSIEISPVFPDLFGATRNLPSMTDSAEKTRLVAIVAKALCEKDQLSNANAILTDVWPQLAFQFQGYMDSATASPLAQPHRYEGFFRDNLENFSFNLKGQSSQILSLLALRECLIKLKLEKISPTPETNKEWQTNWSRIEQSPFLLTTDLVINNARTPGDVRKLSGGISKGTTTTIHAKGGKITGLDKTPTSKIIKKPTSSKKQNR